MDKVFFEHVPLNGKILLLLLASESPKISAEKRMEWAGLARPDIKTDFLLPDNYYLYNFDDYDAISISGGSTYLLKRLLDELELIEKLKKYIRAGGLVYGGSAGAMILSKDIDNSRPEDNPELLGQGVSTEGLDLLGGYCVATHWPICKDFVMQMHKDKGYKFICLPENTGAWFDTDGKLIKTIGDNIEFIE